MLQLNKILLSQDSEFKKTLRDISILLEQITLQNVN